MSDRKYRQRGYQDDNRPRPSRDDFGRGGPDADGARPTARPERAPGAPAGARRISSEGARNPKMPGFRQVARCARCGTFVDAQIFSRSKCPKCQQDLRSCAQCVHFDPGARFECTQPITARISPKDVANDCAFFSPRTSWERETSSAEPASRLSRPARKKAFDDLFKF